MSSETVLKRLVDAANPDGGWGYAVGKASHPEPTCLALLALRAAGEQFAPQVANGLAALERHRQPDGGYQLTDGRPEAGWPTAIALFTKLALAATVEEVKPTVAKVLAVESRTVAKDPETDDPSNDLDQSLVGWPWATANFGWVEPTAWACLALRAAGLETHPRTEQGLKLLLDRAFASGGVNYGNRVVLGSSTEPIPTPTALMLLALQGTPDNPRVDAAVGYLRVHAAQSHDLEHLSWARVALGVHDSDTATRELLPELDKRIAALAADPGVSVHRLALAALALGGTNPFQLRYGPPPASATDVTVAGSGAPAGGLLAKVASKFRGAVVAGIGALKPLPATSAVHIAKADSYDAPLVDILAKQFEHFRPFLPLDGKRVVLKPNLVEYRAHKVINTDPRVVDAVITLCKKEGAAEIVVAEGPGHWRNVEFLVRESGLGAVLDKHGVPFLDINHDEPVKVLNLGRLTKLDHLYMSRTILGADVLISLPKLKMHHWAGVTLSLKNLFGTMPGICYGWPKNELHWRGIPQSIVDISCTRPANLSIIDGIVGMEGDGPLHGTARHAGVLVMGLDPVAVDSTGARLMGMPPDRVPTLVYAAAKRVGRMAEAEIPQLGEPLASVAQKWEWPPMIEKQLIPAPKQTA